MTPIWLGLIGLSLALIAPAVLVRASWPRVAPAAAIVLWQSVALAAILAISGAAVSTALWLVADGRPAWWQITLNVAIIAVGVLVWARFWWAAWQVWRETSERRTRHRHLADLLGEPHGAGPAVRILAEQTPIAYCIPGNRDHRVVISSGTLDSLQPDALDAVLEHERAHVRLRHDVVLEAFGVLHRAFPRPLRTDAPLKESQVLVELMADDAARRRTGNHALARAIVALAGSPVPPGTLGVAGSATLRVERIVNPAGNRARLLSATASLTLAAVLLIAPTVLLAIPWMINAVEILTR